MKGNERGVDLEDRGGVWVRRTGEEWRERKLWSGCNV